MDSDLASHSGFGAGSTNSRHTCLSIVPVEASRRLYVPRIASRPTILPFALWEVVVNSATDAATCPLTHHLKGGRPGICECIVRNTLIRQASPSWSISYARTGGSAVGVPSRHSLC